MNTAAKEESVKEEDSEAFLDESGTYFYISIELIPI